MALTDAEIAKVADATARRLLNLDGVIQAGDGNTTTNPHWTLKFHVYDTNSRIRAVQTAVAALAARMPGDVDEAAIVQGVLAGLAPEQLAGHIAAALGPDVARAVADELRARLEA